MTLFGDASASCPLTTRDGLAGFDGGPLLLVATLEAGEEFPASNSADRIAASSSLAGICAGGSFLTGLERLPQSEAAAFTEGKLSPFSLFPSALAVDAAVRDDREALKPLNSGTSAAVAGLTAAFGAGADPGVCRAAFCKGVEGVEGVSMEVFIEERVELGVFLCDCAVAKESLVALF